MRIYLELLELRLYGLQFYTYEVYAVVHVMFYLHVYAICYMLHVTHKKREIL